MANIGRIFEEQVQQIIEDSEKLRDSLKDARQTKVHRPAFMVAVFVIAWILLMLKYTGYLLGLLFTDFQWCRRMKSHRRFMNCME